MSEENEPQCTTVGLFSMSPTAAELFTALSKAQADITTPKRDKTAKIGNYSYSYADLASTRDVTRKSLKDNGLAIVQMPSTDDSGQVSITTLITHSSGEWIAPPPLSGVPTQATPQGIGSIITYLRRYALSAVLNMATEEDDDGKAASDTGTAKGATKGKTTKKSGAQITDAQSKKLFATSMEQAKKLKIKQKVIVDDLLAILGYSSTKDIKKEDVDKCLKFIEHYGKNNIVDQVADFVMPDTVSDSDPTDGLGQEDPPF